MRPLSFSALIIAQLAPESSGSSQGSLRRNDTVPIQRVREFIVPLGTRELKLRANDADETDKQRIRRLDAYSSKVIQAPHDLVNEVVIEGRDDRGLMP